MTPRRRFQIWVLSLAVFAIGVGLAAVTIHQMMSGLIAFGRRYHRVEVRLDEAPILFWSTGVLVLLFSLTLVAVALWFILKVRQDQKLEAFLAEGSELDRPVRSPSGRPPKS